MFETCQDECTDPFSLPWVRYEVLALMGFPFCHLSHRVIISRLGHNKLTDLAGNAFSGFSLLAVVTALMTVLAPHAPSVAVPTSELVREIPAAQSAPPRVQAAVRARPVACAGRDSDDDL